jgi:outer membrane immunogenic protein
LGWLAADNFLLYGTGGLAYCRVGVSVNLSTQLTFSNFDSGFAVVCMGGTSCFVGSTTQTRVGYTAGAGAAYVISRNVSFFAEYLYVNLGSIKVNSVAVNGGAGIPPSSTAHFSDAVFNVVRAGLNYKF